MSEKEPWYSGMNSAIFLTESERKYLDKFTEESLNAHLYEHHHDYIVDAMFLTVKGVFNIVNLRGYEPEN